MIISPPLPVQVYERPKEGPRAARISLVLPDDNGSVVDLATVQWMGEACKIQTLFIDNSANTDSLTITTNTLQQTLFIPPNSQGFLPLLSTQPLKLAVESAGSGAVTIFALNYSVNPSLWGLTSGGSVPDPLHVIVDNFPAVYPASQSGAWNVGINNFPAGFLVAPNPGSVWNAAQSGVWNVGVNNFPATFPVTQGGAFNVGVNNFPAAYPSGELPTANFRDAFTGVASVNHPAVIATLRRVIVIAENLTTTGGAGGVRVTDGGGNIILQKGVATISTALNAIMFDTGRIAFPLANGGNPWTVQFLVGTTIATGAIEVFTEY